MTLETLFTACNAAVMPAWLLLVFAPGWRFTQGLVHAVWIPILLGAVYAGLIYAARSAPSEGDFSTLAGVMQLFDSPVGALAGWVHYLAFDLFVGAWEVRDARRHEISHLFVVPCLVLTLMLGPAGLLVYLLVRTARLGTSSLLA